LVVKSLGHQFSAGIRSSAVSSTTLNQDLVVLVGPALEYDFFPYAQATRRQVLILVDLGFIHSNYTERTIFGRLSEFLVSQRVTLAADVKQHWGALRGAVEFSAYWGDLSKNRLEIHTGLDVRVFRGLSLTIVAGYSRVRDQLSIAAGGASPEEILLRLKQLETSYRYSLSTGLSYNFGAIFSSVVNPRLDRQGFIFQ
jgi:hypothetical protein